ncbi:MAG: gluconate 2-dehydrogenase subunit 3 family protein [Candidatus Marivariicella sp.]
MNRRKAFQNILMLTCGSALITSCKFENSIYYSNVKFDLVELEFIDNLISSILPINHMNIYTPESTANFVLTMLNDCYDQIDVNKFKSGLRLFQLLIQNKFKKTIENVSSDDINPILNEIENLRNHNENIRFFVKNLKDLSIRHFTTSEYYLTKQLDYEFIPGPNFGCFTI